ncbi:MAG: hypothetical protein HOY78_27585 [Saccharothrix sp.]|nr:hypothetical protein [Saccharothrix sp.]
MTRLLAEPVPDVEAVRAEFDALIAAVWDVDLDPGGVPPASRPSRPPHRTRRPAPTPEQAAPAPDAAPRTEPARQRSPPRRGSSQSPRPASTSEAGRLPAPLPRLLQGT